MYMADSWPNKYWNAQRNTTEWSLFIRELTLSGNRIVELMLEALAPTLQGAHIGALIFRKVKKNFTASQF